MEHLVRKTVNFVMMLSFCAIGLSSCSTYSSKFACTDSRGVPCTMMRAIDKKIDSGEIDRAYKNNCKGKNCKQEESADDPIQPQTSPIRAKLIKHQPEEEVVLTEEE